MCFADVVTVLPVSEICCLRLVGLYCGLWIDFHPHILFLCEGRAPLAIGKMTPSKRDNAPIEHN
jgi:hypothetical protein